MGCFSFSQFMTYMTLSDKATQKKMATDPMYKLEHGSDDKDRGKTTQMSVAQIEDMRESWIDDYMLNKMARNKFRVSFDSPFFNVCMCSQDICI